MTIAGGGLSPLDYHHATKHAFGRFARSLGYLDWAAQPSPFRRFAGAPLRHLPRTADGRDVLYADLFTDRTAPEAISFESVGEFLRCSLGLSAWKTYGASRWALRVNPSSGNLHPTEGYVVWDGGVHHYAPAEHALEQRAVLPRGTWPPLDTAGGAPSGFLVALTSIHWREAWKYGERAFRYCQHDVGHALGALRMSAAMLGWRMSVLTAWSHADVSAVLGLDRDEDFGDAEREAPDLIVIVSGASTDFPLVESRPLVEAARIATWRGHANRLSVSRVDWPLIDEVASGTVYPGEPADDVAPQASRDGNDGHGHLARQIILQRRSATGFNPRGVLRKETFLSMLQRLVPGAPPWDAQSWSTETHLALFVHRVQDVVPGIYAYLRADDGTLAEWREVMRPEFLWERMPATGLGLADGLFLLAPLDVRSLANRLSCDQDIAADGFFSLGMVARLASVREKGPWRYRQLFWECGLIGQVLYLEAEAAGARATGIGCFYDDPVHQALGLTDDRWQSLYHFSMGLPTDDDRLRTEPGYAWETRPNP